jgi:hypothetical protein
MMLFLVFNVLKYTLYGRLRNGVSGITCLPRKFLRNDIVLIYEMGATTFYLFDNIGN